ncbi:MAG: hypothetical protein GC206_01410 [Alphaproteobacteria bacterium]|nr:hypothetical protein [Alphaproteobacteria bacterium]
MLAKALLLGLIPFTADPDAISAPYAHDRAILGLSLIAGVIGSFAALELAGRATLHRGATRAGWMLASGAIMGAGVWATHWIGLLAFESPLLHGYDLQLTGLSAAVAISISALAFLVSWDGSLLRLILAGALGGACAIAMHYIGMAGLQIEAEVSYRPVWFALSSAGAVIAITIGYWLAHVLDDTRLRAATALVIGAIAAGLHYFDVFSTVIAPAPQFTPAASPEPFGPALASLGALIVLCAAALGATILDRRRQATAANDPESAGYVIEIPTASENGAGRRPG